MKATLKYTSAQMDLLFNFDRLLDLVQLLAGKSGSGTLETISSLAEGYDGLLMGFALRKEE